MCVLLQKPEQRLVRSAVYFVTLEANGNGAAVLEPYA